MTDFAVAAAIAVAKVIDSSKVVYATSLPEVLDFTGGRGGDVFVYGAGGQAARIPLSRDRNLMMTASSLLQESVLKKGMTLVGWDIKNVFAFLKAVTGNTPEVSGTVVDLMVVERYLGNREGVRPESLEDAVARLKVCMKDRLWEKAKRANSKVFTPLATTVIPAIEASGLIHADERALVHPYYEVEGQVNGRLKASKSYFRGFNPHNLGKDAAAKLYPSQCDHLLALFDYRHMEVSVLAWLSQDEQMMELLAGDTDFYAAVFTLITGITEVTATHRKLVKALFLPTFYGQSAETLCKKLADDGFKISDTLAKKMSADVHRLFAKAMAWIRDTVPADGVAEDYYGRRRILPDNFFRARNFSVQSPASLICLDRLVHLYTELREMARVVAHVHDGYLIAVPVAHQRDVLRRAAEALEAESGLAPGLRLKVNYKLGKNFGELVEAKPHLIGGD